MLPIQGPPPLPAAAPTRRTVAAGGAGFTLYAASAPAEQAGLRAAAADLGAMLAIQEEADGGPDNPLGRDRRARRRGQDLLRALGALQQKLLAGGTPESGLLDSLTALAAEAEDAADPALRRIVAEIALRARVELARYGIV